MDEYSFLIAGAFVIHLMYVGTGFFELSVVSMLLLISITLCWIGSEQK